MDLLKIFRMPEPVSKDLLTKNSQLSHYKEAVLEKDVLVKNHLARIKDLENEIAELKSMQTEMQHKLRATNLDENEFHNVMVSYDNFIHKLWTERHDLITERTVLEKHISNLETMFEKLLEKYEYSRIVIDKIVKREDDLIKQIDDYKAIIEEMKTKFTALKEHSQSKIAEANLEIDSKEKDNIQEVAKLKAKILQSQAKINELEKHVKIEGICTRQSIFEPLRNNIPK